MDPDEFDAYLESLPVNERRQALYDFGFQNANFVPPTFQGAFGPELTQSEYDIGQYTQAPPSMDSSGNIEPWSLDVAKDLANWQQDMGDLTADPVMAALAGRGAFDPAAFAPVITPVGEPLDQPNRRYVETMAKTGPGYQSYLAQKILDGMNPGQAIATMWDEINAADAPEAPQEAKTLAEALRASLPPAQMDPNNPASMLPSTEQAQGDLTTPQGRISSTNVDSITETANDLFYKMTADQPVGYVDPNTGLQYAGSTQEPSELAAHFAELGIPTPFESYTDPKYLQNYLPEEHWTEREQRLEGLKGRVGEAQDIVEQMRTTLPELRKAWQESQQGPQQPEFPETQLQPTPTPEAMDVTTRAAIGAAGPSPTGGWGGGFVPPPVNMIPGVEEQRMKFYEDEARKEAGLVGGVGVGDEAAYQDLINKRARQKYETVKAAGTNQPFRITDDEGRVVGAYTFGGGTKKEQEAMGKLMGIIAWGQGGAEGDVGGYAASPFDRSFIGDYRDAIQQAVEQRQGAQNYYNQQRTYMSPEEGASIFEGARAYAMEQAGRTPMEDALMQRALGRSLVNPYEQYGY